MAWLPNGEKISKISLSLLAQLTNVTDRRIDTACRHILRLCIASRGKNCAVGMFSLTTDRHEASRASLRQQSYLSLQYWWHLVLMAGRCSGQVQQLVSQLRDVTVCVNDRCDWFMSDVTSFCCSSSSLSDAVWLAASVCLSVCEHVSDRYGVCDRLPLIHLTSDYAALCLSLYQLRWWFY